MAPTKNLQRLSASESPLRHRQSAPACQPLPVRLGKDHSQRRRYHCLIPSGNIREQIAREVHPAALPACSEEHLGNPCFTCTALQAQV